jgi:hypothetical protein
MGDARRLVKQNGDGFDPEALLDRLVEESLAESTRTKSATVAYVAPMSADEFLNDAVSFLRHRPDRDEVLARLAEMCRAPAPEPSAAEPEALEADPADAPAPSAGQNKK